MFSVYVFQVRNYIGSAWFPKGHNRCCLPVFICNLPNCAQNAHLQNLGLPIVSHLLCVPVCGSDLVGRAGQNAVDCVSCYELPISEARTDSLTARWLPFVCLFSFVPFYYFHLKHRHSGSLYIIFPL